MKKNKQLIYNKGNGDCFRACLASILNWDNDPKLPNIDDKNWLIKWGKILEPYGMRLEFDFDKSWSGGYWIASVKSKNFKGQTHAIVMNEMKVAFDPSPKKKYRIGQSLIGKNVICGRWVLIVTDTNKIFPNLK